jgi:hypothetical protein
MAFKHFVNILGFEVLIVFSQSHSKIASSLVLDRVFMGFQPIKAKPCPFCGSSDLVLQEGEDRGKQHGIPCFQVFCTDCGAAGGSHYSIKKASRTYRGVRAQVQARIMSAQKTWNARCLDA